MNQNNKHIAQSSHNDNNSKAVIAMKQQTFSGSLPSPDILRGYEAICPGAADRIIKMAEKQSDHRQMLELNTITTNNQTLSRGQVFAFIIALTGLIVAGVLGFVGRETSASIIGGSSLLGLVSAFISGKTSQRKSLKEKSKHEE